MREDRVLKEIAEERLNPYSIGRYSMRENVQRNHYSSMKVLILILLEDTL